MSGVKKVTVYCSQFARCRWIGKRGWKNATDAPCPRCGGKVAR